MKKLLLLLLLVAPFTLLAKVPYEDDIIEQINDAASPYYYPNLFIRFNSGGEFTAEEFHYLYYGFAYSELYRPLEVNDKIDRVLLLASSLDTEAPAASTLDEIVISANEALVQNPFSPTLWNLLAFSYGALGDSEREKMAFDRFNMILSTIDSSGDGLKEKSPKHIIMFDHALDLLTSQGVPHSKAKVISRTVEYIPFLETQRDGGASGEGKKVKGLYFDFGRIYWNKPDNVTYKRDQTWQFNNLKPKEYK
ncbi:MAG: DUF4919 domain-containing protein [Rikenellaceae bacterium]